MKKRWILLILPLMMALMMNAASANQWGLRGQALNIVEHTHDYDEYSCVADDYKSQTNATRVILGSRYHNQLVAVDEVKDGWKDAIFLTTAVYQPSELDETGYPKITRTKNGFELAYPDIDERYYFELSHNNEGRTFYTLMEAQMGDVKVERIASYGYRVTLGDGRKLVFYLAEDTEGYGYLVQLNDAEYARYADIVDYTCLLYTSPSPRD